MNGTNQKNISQLGFAESILAWMINQLTRDRSDRVIRRTQLFLLVLTVLLVTLALSYPNLKQPYINLTENGPYGIGRSAPDTLVAVTDVEFLREKSFEQARENARNRTPLHITLDYGLLRDDIQYPDNVATWRRLRTEDMQIQRECRSKQDWKQIWYCARSKSKRWRRLSLDEFKELTFLPYAAQDQMQQRALNLVFTHFVVLKKTPEGSNKVLYDNFNGDQIVIHNLNHASSAKPEQLSREALIKPDELWRTRNLEIVEQLISEHIPRTSLNQRSGLARMSMGYMYELDAARISQSLTDEAQQEAISAVKRSDHTYKIKRGQVILKKGDIITEEMRRSLELHQEKRTLEIVKRILSILIQMVILTMLMLYFALRFSAFSFRDLSSNLIVFSSVWLFALMLVLLEKAWAGRASEFELTHFFGSWVPVGIFSVLLALIFGERLTIALAMYISFLVFIASKYDGLSFLVAIVMSLAATILGSRVKRRFQFITTALILSGLNVLLVIAGYLYSNRPLFGWSLDEGWISDGLEKAVLIALASGLSTIAVIGLLPIYETLFNIPTRFKLQELADPSHPLLRQLFQQAPSTWTHTLMVAALSEKACERLKLNVMLTRTGVYFHDIGKMKNAGFFAENKHLIPKDENINRDKPHVAARVIIDHVLDGLTLARQYRLPKEVIAFIPEHHGTSTMAFFYHQALEKMKRKVDREDFRYPGPIPQSKETGIVMIADSVEAASRTLDEVNEASLNALILKIIKIKQSEDQLDESGLTMGDLKVIQEAFKDVLISSYHHRPKYPDQQSTAELEANQASKGRGRKKTSKKNAS
ncbi:MAG: HDIG domain-containing protein [Leptospiraceae bacterium]|nr:HDIG domain-containing protein [Leptospiraceae bacterium]